jgi:hypothetical protein
MASGCNYLPTVHNINANDNDGRGAAYGFFVLQGGEMINYEIITGIIGAYFLFFALGMNCSDLKSSVFFKVIPFFSGLTLIEIAFKVIT